MLTINTQFHEPNKTAASSDYSILPNMHTQKTQKKMEVIQMSSFFHIAFVSSGISIITAANCNINKNFNNNFFPGISSMLTFITLSSQTGSAMSKVSYIIANEVWFIACTTFIIGSLVEFAFVNTIWRRR